jgi:probable HAF family extracellular repeat protein
MQANIASRAALAIAALSATLGAHAAPLYHLVDLGPVDWPTGVNGKSQVAGDTEFRTPAVYKDGAWQTLKAPSGYAETTGINSGGSVSGSIFLKSPRQAVVWKPSGQRIEAPQVNPDDPQTNMSADGIADDGTLVGTAASPNGLPSFYNVVFRWKPGSAPENLGNPPDSRGATAAGINKKGQIIGQAVFDGTNFPGHAFLYTAGEWRDLGTFGGDTSTAVAINLKGQVVGCADIAHDTVHHHAFLYTDHQMVDLGAPAGTRSCALGIASDGTVGGTYIDDKKVSKAFIYQDGVRYDKVSPLTDADDSWRLYAITAVAPNGVMVGHGLSSQGLRAFMLQPVAQQAESTPAR